MIGETTISYVKIGNHPIETTISQYFYFPLLTGNLEQQNLTNARDVPYIFTDASDVAEGVARDFRTGPTGSKVWGGGNENRGYGTW